MSVISYNVDKVVDKVHGALENGPAYRTSAVDVVDTGDSLAARLASGEILLSVVIPLLNEEESLDELYRRLKAAFAQFAPRHEIIFVDDGSKDGSYRKLRQFWQTDPSVTVLRFRRNFGKAAGLTAAFERVRGEVVIMMDADLQDQPEEFDKLIAKLDEGYDLVSGWKRRRHDPIHKTLPSKLFNGTVAGYYNLNIHDFNCGLKIMRAEVAADIRIYGDWHRFIPVLAATKGYRVAECAIEHAPRVHGVSKYGAKRLITGLLDFLSSVLITRFYHKPLQFFGTFGLFAVLAGIPILIYSLVTGAGSAGWVGGVVLLVAGLHFLALGLLAELVVKASAGGKRSFEVAEVLEPSL